MPKLLFAIVVIAFKGNFVIGMNLYGYICTNVEQFDKYGELEIVNFKYLVPYKIAEIGLEDIKERISLKKALANHGTVIAQVNYFPGLPDMKGIDFSSDRNIWNIP